MSVSDLMVNETMKRNVGPTTPAGPVYEEVSLKEEIAFKQSQTVKAGMYWVKINKVRE